MVRKPTTVHKDSSGGGPASKSKSEPSKYIGASASSSGANTSSFDYSPHGGVTFKENPNLSLQMVGTAYGGDDTSGGAVGGGGGVSSSTNLGAVDPRPVQSLSKSRRRVSRGKSPPPYITPTQPSPLIPYICIYGAAPAAVA